MKKLPIGIQTFSEIITDDYLYIDKTQCIHQLITGGKIYFMSRPRRFGKSLLISTLEAIFKGQKELFKDLWIEKSDLVWDEHPVIRVDFAGLDLRTPEKLEYSLAASLDDTAKKYDIYLTEQELKLKFKELVTKLSAINKVVLLVDEYDKPIIEHIDNPAAAAANREVIKQFYGCIKPLDEYLKFVFLTGVSKFSQVSIFSDLNSLQDISMSIKYADLLGITQEELETQCIPYIADLAQAQALTVDETYAKIKHWYNGFNFSKANIKVYNPFSTLLLFAQQDFKGYWFATATPTFLIKLVKKHHDLTAADLNALYIEEVGFTRFDVENLKLEALLFQTGYLTIESYDNQLEQYKLCFPNYEVKSAFLADLIDAYSYLRADQQQSSYIAKLIMLIKDSNLDEFIETLKVFFANIPYSIQLKQEKYYQSIFYTLFTLLGFKIIAEVTTNKGRIDAVVEVNDTIYLFEFKLYESAKAALEQINTQEYYQKYLKQNKQIVLVGVGFDQDERNIGQYLAVKLDR